MASQEPIERLYVKLEADARELLGEIKGAVSKGERELESLDRTARKVGRFDGLKKGFQAVAGLALKAAAAVTGLALAIGAAVRAANKAIGDLRAERAFRNLAASMGQSSDAILDAIDRASAGAVSKMDAIQAANQALLLNVARTPEEFEKLARAAIALGRTRGLAPLESIMTLITAAGRRSVMVLDNLGLSLADVNAAMDRLAMQEFGRPASQLSQVQRNALFTSAALEVAARKAEQLGTNFDDAGSELERWNADSAELKQELNELALIMTTIGAEGANQFARAIFQGETFMQRAIRVAKDLQQVLIQITALLAGIAPALAQARQNLEGFLRGERGIRDLGEGVAEAYVEGFQERLGQLEERFQEILNPEAAVDAILPPMVPDELDERANEIKKIVGDLANDLMDLQSETNAELEKLATDHADKMLSIESDLADALNELAEETAEKRAKIFADARKALAALAAETDRALAEERDDFQTEERRATEDHLRDMRRLTEDYLMDLEDAVKERDARAVVDLQRRFRLEQRRREEDFNTRQGREREDFADRLQEIRDHEAERRQEILDAQAEQLQDLMAHEEKRRRELEKSAAELRARETRDYEERQAELQGALLKRLQTIARELADEEQLNEESARRLLGILNRTFGVGGDIDRLMEDFANRRRQRMIVQVSFEGIAGVPPEQQPVFFQGGGTMIARKPTLGVFGESGPEVINAIPLNRLGGGEFGFTRRHEFDVDFNLHGNVPPTMSRGELEDQMAGVMLRALRDSGALSRG